MQPICLKGKCVGCGCPLERGTRTEVGTLLSNGSLMRVGCCLSCCSTILNDKEALWSAVYAGWDEQTQIANAGVFIS